MTPLIAKEEGADDVPRTKTLLFRLAESEATASELVLEELVEAEEPAGAEGPHISQNVVVGDYLVYLSTPLLLKTKRLSSGNECELVLNSPVLTLQTISQPGESKDATGYMVILINRNNSFSAIRLSENAGSFSLSCVKEKLLVNSQHADVFNEIFPLANTKNTLFVSGKKIVSLIQATATSIKSKCKSLEELGFSGFTVRSCVLAGHSDPAVDVASLLLERGKELAVVELHIRDGIKFAKGVQKELSPEFLDSFSGLVHVELERAGEGLVLFGSKTTQPPTAMQPASGQDTQFYMTYIDKVGEPQHAISLRVAHVEKSAEAIEFELMGEDWYLGAVHKNTIVFWGTGKIAVAQIDPAKLEDGAKDLHVFRLSVPIEWGELDGNKLMARNKRHVLSAVLTFPEKEPSQVLDKSADTEPEETAETQNLVQETSLQEAPEGLATNILSEIKKENAKLLESIKKENALLLSTFLQELTKKQSGDHKKTYFFEENRKKDNEASRKSRTPSGDRQNRGKR